MKSLLRRLPTTALLLSLGLLNACGGSNLDSNLDSGGQPVPGSLPDMVRGTARVAKHPDDSHVPHFARVPFAPFSRQDAIAIAVREWRLFGQRIDDDQPGSQPPRLPDQKAERMPGLWQRAGEYWFEGIDAKNNESDWTGKHDAYGVVFPAADDGEYAWSAAFISYVMRIAGAGDKFPYSSVHADYINLGRIAPGHPWVVNALPPQQYAPTVGDLVCMSRGRHVPLKYADLPTPTTFPGHCDIVVAVDPGMLTVIGGNVDDAVTMKHVPVTPAGMIATPDGTPVDTRYHWFVVLQILYAA